MRTAVICEPVRTPVGRFGGALARVDVATLAATLVSAVVERTGLPGTSVDDVIVGQGYPNGEAPAIGRIAALDGGLGVSVPGGQVDRRCGSGLMAVVQAAMQVQTGASDVVLAGGVESMSQVEHYTTALRSRIGERVDIHDRLARARATAGGRLHPIAGGMIETAETLRREFGISRADQDELAVESHRRAVAAQAAGAFDDELVAVEVPSRGAPERVAIDEHPRPDTTLEQLAGLRPIRLADDPDATVTAGNSSGQNDGAALCVVTHPDRAGELGLTPLARLVAWSAVGVEPERMGIGPVPATTRALERAGLTLDDIDLIELNEAFAAQVLAVTRSWGIDAITDARLNVHGSGIALGHPIGATGARLLVTLTRELVRRGGRYGLVTMCIGGGQGMAAVIERVDAA